MQLQIIDWVLILFFPCLSLVIGAIVARKAGTNSESYFLSGRNMPWWLLGFSMVATTFSTDTPNLVTNIVRTNGVAGNWVWWAFLPTGMITAFIYAKLWRRSGVMTDLEFYKIRYSDKVAGHLRTFRALYIGVFFNIMMMAAVSLAATKIGAVMIGAPPIYTLLVLGAVTMIFSSAGGFLGVVITDLILFLTAMVGAIGAAIFVLGMPEIGGLTGLMGNPIIADKLSILPDFANRELALSIFIIPLVVQWWSVWYPGAEPGGGGYVAQRMLAAKNSRHAVAAVLFFQACHYALRPWPWILVALASLIVFPDLESIHRAFPDIPADTLGHDLAYPAMLTFLPSGLLGLVVASLASAYMSSMATQLNWGASYVVNDFWRAVVKPNASEKELVRVGRIATIVLMVCAATLALFLSSALQAFNILLSVGAGTGLLFLLRWYWWRINAYSEFAAMVLSFSVAVALNFLAPADWTESFRLVIGVAITTVGWILVTLLTRPVEMETLYDFVRLVNPGGPGWTKVRQAAARDGVELPDSEDRSFARSLACVPVTIVGLYSLLFGTGYLIYGDTRFGIILYGITALSLIFVARSWHIVFAREDEADRNPTEKDEFHYGH